ncbi:MAG: GlsB/YeaQ/YmgE family stress response membrane protein [Chloroflexi bacterium]|nr:MAG: GlsB/YeaQ/YmgE family stress response membrane protein [Chloroflexota bacterium]
MKEVIFGDVTLGQLIFWLIIGGAIGSIVGRVLRDRRRGYGMIGNIVVGLIGALIGGFLFDQLNINIWDDIVISFNDLIAAFVGAVLFVTAVWFIRRQL